MIAFLLHKGAKSTIAEFSQGRTPLMAAAERNAVGTVERLLAAADAASALRVVNARGKRADEVTGSPTVRALILSALDHSLPLL